MNDQITGEVPVSWCWPWCRHPGGTEPDSRANSCFDFPREAQNLLTSQSHFLYLHHSTSICSDLGLLLHATGLLHFWDEGESLVYGTVLYCLGNTMLPHKWPQLICFVDWALPALISRVGLKMALGQLECYYFYCRQGAGWILLGSSQSTWQRHYASLLSGAVLGCGG